MKERSKKLGTRKRDLERVLAETDEPPPLLHPNMAPTTARRSRNFTRAAASVAGRL